MGVWIIRHRSGFSAAGNDCPHRITVAATTWYKSDHSCTHKSIRPNIGADEVTAVFAGAQFGVMTERGTRASAAAFVSEQQLEAT